MALSFKATVRKDGNSYVVGIPKSYIENNLLAYGEEYTFTIDEVVP